MSNKKNMKCVPCYVFIVVAAIFCEAQREPALPLSNTSLQLVARVLSDAPRGRIPVIDDITIRHYTTNVTSPKSRRIGNITSFLKDPDFDVNKPTVIYMNGYLEVFTDDSILTVMSAYIRAGGYNAMLVDWSNLGFGNYIKVAKTLPRVGERVGKALLKLLKKGLPIKSLHLVGHSMGCHLASYASRYLSSRGFIVPRLTGLDPAYPLYYPPIAAPHMSASDATFVDVIHTDGGYFGTPSVTGHADYWPNGGQSRQPGCISATIPLTTEDFCSHWRSWTFWAESLLSDGLLARRCIDYDTFLRGECQEEPIVSMGVRATPDLRGNFYLRTAAKSPYGLGVRGVS